MLNRWTECGASIADAVEIDDNSQRLGSSQRWDSNTFDPFDSEDNNVVESVPKNERLCDEVMCEREHGQNTDALGKLTNCR